MIISLGLIPSIGIALALWQLCNARSVLTKALLPPREPPSRLQPRRPLPDKWREDMWQKRHAAQQQKEQEDGE